MIALSHTQQGLLADSLASEDRGVNVEQVLYEVNQWLTPDILRAAWQGALNDFDALRLRFELQSGGKLVQHCVESVLLPFQFVDWSARDATNVAEDLEAFLEQDRHRGFDLFSVPLFRVTALRLPASRTIVLWTVHHAIIDGASYPIVLRRVFARYEDLCAGRPTSKPSQPPYLAFLKWLRDRDHEPGVAYFRDVLRGVTEPTPLPLSGLAQHRAAQGSRETRCELSPEGTAALLSAAADMQVSINTIVQLAWGLLLGRYASCDDVVFGATWSGRQNTIEHAEQVVGPFINTLPVRLDVSGRPSVRDALRALREQHLGSRPFHQTPLMSVKAQTGLSRARHMFQTIVVFERQNPLAGLQAESGRHKFWSRSQTGYPLSLGAHLQNGALILDLEFDTRLYHAKQAGELLDNLARLVGAVPGALDQCVHDIPMLAPTLYSALTTGEAEREVVPERPPVLEQIFEHAERRPDAPAICDLAGASISFSQLRAKVIRVARALRRIGVKSGSIVAILLPRSIELVVSELAVHHAGAGFLILDLTDPIARLRYKLEDSGSRWLIVNVETKGLLPPSGAQELDSEALDSRDGVEHQPAPSDSSRSQPFRISPNELAYLIYTSGSTGEPKGVCISSASLANHVAATRELFELQTSDRVLQFHAECFDASLEEIFPTLAAGATLVLRSEPMTRSPRAFLDAVAEHGLTVLDLPTGFWHQIVHLADRQEWPRAVRLLIVGGERVSPRVHQRFRDAATKHVRWLNSYGPTEATITSTAYDDRTGDHTVDHVPIGRPLAGYSHFVLDHRLRPVPPTVTGHLYIGGAGVALGYHERRLLNEERFIAHPWRAGAKLYATGDLVRTTERGNYVYVDRVDHQVKVRGFRVELGEIEARLRQHPAVREAAVVVQERGGSAPRLVGFVESESDLAPRSLREYVAAALPPYMVPAHLIVDQELPKTPAGKIDRQALAARDLNQQQENRRPESEFDPLELALLEIWSDILGVTVRDSLTDFFDLGGNSLLVLNLFAAIERRFNKAVNPVAFFRTPTLVHLAEMIRTSAGDESRTPLLRLVVGSPGVRPLFFTPGVPGRGFDYVHLAQALDATIPLYSLQVRGLRTGEIPHRDTVAAARDYANWIQEVQPKGPYALAGFSAGCIVAIAVADVLLQRGERLDFVGLIDGIPPTTIRFPTPFSSPRRFARFARTTVDRVREILKRPDAAQALWWRGRSAARRVMTRWLPGMADHEVSVDDLFIGSGLRFTKKDWQLMQAHLSMLMHYKPDPVALDIVLFRSLLDPFEGPYEAELGWSRLVTGRIAVEVLASRHRGLLGASGAPELGKRINHYLQQRRR